MTKKTKDPQDDFGAEAEAAPERPEIYPQLPFGDSKHAGGHYEVEFIGNPYPVEFDDTTQEKGKDGKFPKAQGWAVPLVVLAKDEYDDDVKPGQRRSILFRRPTIDADGKKRYHGLTRGVLDVRKKQGTLVGVRVHLGTRVYEHKQWGKTRGYDVWILGADKKPNDELEDDLPN